MRSRTAQAFSYRQTFPQWMNKMRKLLSLFVLISTVGCGGSDSTSPATSSVVGTYALKSIDGLSLPYVTDLNSASKTEVLDATYSLNADGSYSQLVHYRMTTATSVTVTNAGDVGAYLSVNGALTLFSTTGLGQLNGSVGGGTLTIVASSVLVYTRQ